eukprot:3133976-Alexandrium_andersonii.AAC.1
MFPAFDASLARAVTNAFALRAALGDFEGAKAAREFRQREAGPSGSPPSCTPVAACDASLVMGDPNAVDYGMGARVAVLWQDPEVLPGDQWARP